MSDCAHLRPLQVLILNWRDSGHPDGGGSELYAEQVADGLAARGLSVTILTARYPGSARQEVRPSGVKVHRSGGRLTVYPAAAWAYLTRQVRRPDIIVETQNGVPYLAALWAPRTPLVVLVHHVHREQWPVIFGPATARLGWWVESRLAPFVNRRRPYVAVSEVTKAELGQLGVEACRVSVVHNGAIEPPAHDVERSVDPQLLVLGRLVPHKRIEVALETLEQLTSEFPRARLVIAGRGWWEDAIRDEVWRRGLQSRVDLLGYVSVQERHRLLATSWVSLVPSVKEGWGLVVVEAGMHRTPTVAFDGTGGLTESIIDRRTGRLARPDDVEHFVEITRELLRDAELRSWMGDQAEIFASSFTWPRTVDSFHEVLAQTVARRKFRLKSKS